MLKNWVRLGFGLMTWSAVGMMSLSGAIADDVKLGVVDMQKALQSIDAGKQAKATLEKEFNSKKKELQSEEASIKKMADDAKKQAAAWSESHRAKKQAEIQEKIMKFQELTARSQAEIQRKEQELTEPLIRSLRSIVEELAKKRNYAMVLEKGGTTVLFHQEKDDLTDEVIAAFNKQSKK